MRSKVKFISSKPIKFIPEDHLKDASLREDAAEIENRPLVFMVKKLTRDEQFRIREMLELKDNLDPSKGIRGSGDIAKFIWENNVVEVRNVILQNEDGTVSKAESVVGDEKNNLWNTSGMDVEIHEAILFARNVSQLDEAEVKN